MLWELFVFTDRLSRRPERLNSRLNLLCQIFVLSWPIRSANDIPESLSWCSSSQNVKQYLMVLHFVFIRLGIEANLSLCLKREFKVKMFFVTMFGTLVQHQIPMQHARTYRAWLPSEIIPKYGNAVEWEKTIVNRFQRGTKRGKFSRAA